MTAMPTGPAPLIERVKNILLRPDSEWAAIDAEPATIGDIYRRHVIPLAAIPAVAGLIGSLVFGYSLLGVTWRPSVGAAVGTAIVQYGGALVGVFLLALIIDALAPSFGATANRVQAFKLAAYSATASWVAGLFSLIPAIGWLSLLGLYSLYLLYLGVPRLMKAPQEKAMGYTVVIVIAAIVLALVVGAIIAPITGLFVHGI